MDENLVSKLTAVNVEVLTSSKTGKPYTTVTYQYVNGYKHRVFLNNEQEFAIKNAAEYKTNKPSQSIGVLNLFQSPIQS